MDFLSLTPCSRAKLASLYREELPVAVRLWAILDGIIEGRVVVDTPDAPKFALVQELAEGTTYSGGAPTRAALSEGISLLRKEREVVICTWFDDPLNALLPPAPYYEGAAIDFMNRAPRDLNPLTSIPAGYELRQIDRELVPRLDGFDYYVSMFGGVERALAQTLGFCLVQGTQVVSEAVAGPLARGIAEIGVGTKEAYRQRGLATITAARLIAECDARGYRPFWNASEQNAPSVALAKRLGFQTAKPFKVVAWSKNT